MDNFTRMYSVAVIFTAVLYPDNSISAPQLSKYSSSSGILNLNHDQYLQLKLDRLRVEASSGSAQSAYQLGIIFKEWFEKDKNNYDYELESMYYFELSSSLGHPRGTYEAAYMLIDYDDDRALELLEKAISLGINDAQELYNNLKVAMETADLSGC